MKYDEREILKQLRGLILIILIVAIVVVGFIILEYYMNYATRTNIPYG